MSYNSEIEMTQRRSPVHGCLFLKFKADCAVGDKICTKFYGLDLLDSRDGVR